MRNIRRDNRARDNKDVMQNKIIIYCIIGVVGLTIILFGLLLYSKYLNENIQNDVIDFEEMANNLNKKDLGFAKHTKEEMINTYRTIYKREDENKYGVVIFKIKVL